MKNSFDTYLIESAAAIKKGTEMLLENLGKAIAILTVIVVTLVTFTEIGFDDFTSKSFTGTLAVFLIATYVIYFSLEDAGERAGIESEDYRKAKESFAKTSSKIDGDMIEDLRDYLIKYSEEELAFRRKCFLASRGCSLSEYEDWLVGERVKNERLRIFKKAKRIKPIHLSPTALISQRTSRSKSELENPESRKRASLFLKLLPSTVCTVFTVSLALSAKDGLTLSSVIEGLLKISALPIIGFRGYVAGYNHTTVALPCWLNTKERLLSSFLKTVCK